MRQPIKINKTNPNKGVLDYSYLLDAPAGKHGFVTTRNGHFYFEGGVRAKFLGLMWLQDQIPRIMKPQRNWRNVLRAWA